MDILNNYVLPVVINFYNFVKKIGEALNDFGSKWHNRTIYSITSSPDSRYVFTSDEIGNFKQIDVEDGEAIKDYGKIFKCAVTCMQCTNDSKFVVVCDENSNIRQYNINTFKLVRSWDRVLNGSILTMALSPDSKSVFVAGSMGICKKFS